MFSDVFFVSPSHTRTSNRNTHHLASFTSNLTPQALSTLITRRVCSHRSFLVSTSSSLHSLLLHCPSLLPRLPSACPSWCLFFGTHECPTRETSVRTKFSLDECADSSSLSCVSCARGDIHFLTTCTTASPGHLSSLRLGSFLFF